ncbi:MAG TPA: ABC transporter substrate-binding protein [Dissulfurispiraceae bacterium]|nr:ABC transporter substrate-binding protein [Dissulfurispiraceae bacterium]
MKRQLGLLFIVILLINPLPSFAATPLDTVRKEINKVLDVLRDNSLKGESGKKIKKSKIRTIANEIFDYGELSRRTLELNWKKLDAGQQKEFIALYAKLLENTYADKILSYSNEKVIYGKERQMSGSTVEVQTTIETAEHKTIPINYRVILKGGEWKIYDVVIENVSLINNYRAQFREILASKPPSALLETLREKVGGKD